MKNATDPQLITDPSPRITALALCVKALKGLPPADSLAVLESLVTLLGQTPEREASRGSGRGCLTRDIVAFVSEGGPWRAADIIQEFTARGYEGSSIRTTLSRMVRAERLRRIEPGFYEGVGAEETSS